MAAATGLRVALPLLLLGLLSGPQLWSQVPLFSQLPAAAVVGLLVSGSTAELVLTKNRHSQRLLLLTELSLSPWSGAIAGVAMARKGGIEGRLALLMGLTSALLALVIQLLQVAWMFRPLPLPLWVPIGVDGLCIGLAVLAFRWPQGGGLVALLLLWLVIRTGYRWRQVTPRPPKS